MAKSSKTNNVYINGTQAGKTLKELRAESRRLNNEINQMAPGTDAYKRKIKELGATKKVLNDHRQELKKVEGSYNKVRSSMGGIKSMIGGFLGAGAIVGAVQNIVSGTKEWIKTNAQLEASLDSLEALTGATAEDLEFYSDEAIRMGASTTQSATQVVDAMKMIGSAKPELLGNREALSQVTEETIRLSEAAQMELGPAADALTGALNQWGDSADQAARYSNVFAAGSKAGSAGIESLGQSIDKSGAVLAGFNIEIEEGIGLLETMAERNIKGAEAGTQLRNVMLTMQGVEALPPKALAQLEKFGVDTEIVSDKTLPLNTRLQEMAKISGDATAMMKVFGRENIVAASAILDNTEKVESYSQAVTGTNTALEQQKINNDNLQGDLKSWSSAWEGMTLTIGGGEGALRSLVQTGTDALNWVTDIAKAFQDWDVTKIETQLLKLAKTMTEWTAIIWNIIPGVEGIRNAIVDWMEEKIRMNELTSEVIDGMEKEQRSLAILTSTLMDNNKALADANTTEEEAAKIKEENAQVIDQLNEKFPELTENIDLQSASNEELVKWQKEASDSILEATIAEVKAAEQKRLLNEIIQQTIELREQEMKEAQRWAATNFIADLFADDAEDIREDIENTVNQVNKLDKTFMDIGGTIKDLDLDFVVDFKTANKAIDNQAKRIKALREEINKAKQEGRDLSALEAQLKAEIRRSEAAEKKKQEIKNEAIKKSQKVRLQEIENMEEGLQKEIALINNKYDEEIRKAGDHSELIKELEIGRSKALKEIREKDSEELELARKKEAEARSKEAEKALEEQRKNHEKLLAELEKLKEEELQINEDKNREIALANKTEAEKEYQEEVFRIEDKYKAQIASATKLAQEKGKIGEQGAEQLAMFELLKQEELINAQNQLKDKQLQEREKAEKEAAEKEAATKLRIEEATWNVKRGILERELNLTGEHEIQKRKEILDQILALEREKAFLDNTRKLEELELQLENEELTKEEYKIRLEEQELEHQNRLTEITQKSSKERSAIQEKQWDDYISLGLNALDAFVKLKGLETDAALAEIDEERDARINSLDTALSKNLISREDYDAEVLKLDKDLAAKEDKIKLEQFNREKTLALVKVAIDTASAIAEALPNIPLSIAAGIAGGAQAAIIAGQTPQFAEGGYTTVTGANDGKKYNAKVKGKANAGVLTGGPQLVLANEKGPEYFIPNPMLNDPQVIDHVRAIENIRVRQFADGGATAPMPESQTTVSTGQSDELMIQMMDVLKQNGNIMNELRARLMNLQVVIGDDKIDQLMDRMQDIEEIRA